MRRSGLSGFTFIEMLVVLALLAMLMSVIAVRLSRSTASSQDKKRLVDLRLIEAGLTLYYSDQDAYPTSLTFGSKLESADGKTYIQEVPLDPDHPNRTYYYEQKATGGFLLCAFMEDDRNIPASGDIHYPPGNYDCGTDNCNYCLNN